MFSFITCMDCTSLSANVKVPWLILFLYRILINLQRFMVDLNELLFIDCKFAKVFKDILVR
jgi:hypothetical protein